MVNKGIVLGFLDFELGPFLEALGHENIGRSPIFSNLYYKKKVLGRTKIGIRTLIFQFHRVKMDVFFNLDLFRFCASCHFWSEWCPGWTCGVQGSRSGGTKPEQVQI